MAGPDTSEWLDAVVTASNELATTMLGMESTRLIARKEGLPNQSEAAYIALVGENTALQLGIGATPKNCMRLAKALMGMTPKEPDLEPEEVADSVSEIVNILAGQVKQIMTSCATVNLGLPIFMRGELFVKSNTHASIAEMAWDDITVLILVLKND